MLRDVLGEDLFFKSLAHYLFGCSLLALARLKLSERLLNFTPQGCAALSLQAALQNVEQGVLSFER